MITKYFADITLYSPTKHRDASSDQDIAASADTDEEHPLISNISASTTAHPQTDFLLEYRIELDPYQLVLLTQSGIEGVREEPADASDVHAEDEEVNGPRNQKRKPKEVDPFSSHRIWVPACMLQSVEKELVDAYEAKQEAKRAKKTRKAPPKGKRTATGPDPDLVTETASISTARSRPKTRKGARAPAGMRAKKATSAPSHDDNAENFDLDAVSDTSDSDAGGGPTTSKSTTTTASRKATARGRKVQREIATDSEADSDTGGEQAPLNARPRQKSIEPLSLSSKPTQAKAARLPRGEPSAQRGPPAQDKSKTSHSSVLKALDAADWDDLFPPAFKAPMPSSLSPSSPTHNHQSQRGSKAGSAAAPSSPSKRRRRQVFSDAGEDSERAESSRGPVPKSPRKSKSQVNPSHRKEKTTVSRTKRQENLVLPYLPSSSDSEDDDVSGADVRGDARRAGSPTPRKGAAKDPFRALWDKVGLTSRRVSKRPEEIIDVSSEDGDECVAPIPRMSPRANADDLAGTITRKGGSTSRVSKATQQPLLPFRPVKTTAAKKPATKTHLAKDSTPTHAQRNTLAADVIDLTTP